MKIACDVSPARQRHVGGRAKNAAGTFLAIDFETANDVANSACALGWVAVVEGAIVEAKALILKNSTDDFRFTELHGITQEMSSGGVDFHNAWTAIAPLIQRCACRVVAHNAKFDRKVLEACARRARVRLPRLRYICTRNLAEAIWGLRPADLATVCQHLNIDLQHHNPLSDAKAAARIYLAALDERLRRLPAGEAS